MDRRARNQWLADSGAAPASTTSPSPARATIHDDPGRQPAARCGGDPVASPAPSFPAGAIDRSSARPSVPSPTHTFRPACKSRRHRQHSDATIRRAGPSSVFAAIATTSTSSIPFLAAKPPEHSHGSFGSAATSVRESAAFRRAWKTVRRERPLRRRSFPRQRPSRPVDVRRAESRHSSCRMFFAT